MYGAKTHISAFAMVFMMLFASIGNAFAFTINTSGETSYEIEVDDEGVSGELYVEVESDYENESYYEEEDDDYEEYEVKERVKERLNSNNSGYEYGYEYAYKIKEKMDDELDEIPKKYEERYEYAYKYGNGTYDELKEKLKELKWEDEKEYYKNKEKIMESFKDLVNISPYGKAVISAKDLEEIIEKAKDDPEKIREELEEKLKERMKLEEKGFKIREISEEYKERVRNEIKKMVEIINKDLDEKKQYEKKLREMKAEYVQCKEINFTAEGCMEVKEEYLNYSKAYLDSVIDASLKHIDYVYYRLTASEYVNESVIQEAITYLEDLNATLYDLKYNLSQCEDMECVKEIAYQLNALTKNLSFEVKYYLTLENNYRSGLILERANSIIARLELAISTAEKENVSLEEVQDEIDEVYALIDEAKQLKEKSDEYMRLAKDSTYDIEQRKEYLEEAKDYLDEANEKLFEANKLVQEIVSYIQNYGELYKIVVSKPEELEELMKKYEYEYRYEHEYKNGSEIETEYEAEGEIEFYGEVVYVDLEGGFYGLVDAEGNQYYPLNWDEIATSYNVSAGAKVKVEATIVPDVATTTMWGVPIYIDSLEVLP